MFRAVYQAVRSLLDGPSEDPTYALMLGGGGARSAYQAGVLRYLSEAFPGTYFPIVTGVSAGAINAAHLGNHTGTFAEAGKHLTESWVDLEIDQIVEVESGLGLLWNLLWRPDAAVDGAPSAADIRRTQGLLDTTPLAEFLRRQLNAPDGDLSGVSKNLTDGRLRALAITTTNYETGQTVTWVEGGDFDAWERPDRIGVHAGLTVDHVMASTAVPIVFPAVQIEGAWYGDGGIRLAAPLAPAVHLGADRILAVSTRYQRSQAEARAPAIQGYPPTAQILGVLMNSIFLDALDQDASALRRINALVQELPPQKRQGMRPIDLLQLRPSVDLGRLAFDYQDHIPGSIRFLTTGLGVDETQSPDWLSVLLFAPAYIDRLLDIGYHDARRQHDRIEAFLAEQPRTEGDRSGYRQVGQG